MITTQTKNRIKDQNELLLSLLNELGEIKQQLRQFMLFFPEESLDEYENAEEINEAYYRAIAE